MPHFGPIRGDRRRKTSPSDEPHAASWPRLSRRELPLSWGSPRVPPAMLLVGTRLGGRCHTRYSNSALSGWRVRSRKLVWRGALSLLPLLLAKPEMLADAFLTAMIPMEQT